MRKAAVPDEDKLLGQVFEARMGRILSELKQGLNELAPIYAKSALILRSKQSLLDLSFSTMIRACGTDHAQIWHGIRKAYRALTWDLGYVATSARNPPPDPEAEGRKARLAAAETENAEMRQGLERLQAELRAGEEERARVAARAEEEKGELQAQVKALEEENKQYLDNIIKRAKEAGSPSPSWLKKAGPSPQRTGSPPQPKKLVFLLHSHYARQRRKVRAGARKVRRPGCSP